MRDRQDLRGVQHRIVDELIDSVGVMVVLGMGGGKTVSALTAADDLLQAGLIRAAVVAAPKRVALSTWPDEIRQWRHLQHLRVGVLSGSAKAREAVLDQPRDIYTCGIDLLPWLLEALKARPNHPAHDLLIIDELSRFKNPRGDRAKALNRASDRFGAIWGLTGTPRPNGWEDLWMPLQIISKGQAWGQPFDHWRRRYFDQLDFQGYRWGVKPERLPSMRKVVDDWSVTIPREEVVDVPFVSGPEHDIIVPLTEDAARDATDMATDLMITLGRGEQSLDDVSADDEEVIVALSAGVASGKIGQIMQGFLYREGDDAPHIYGDAKLAALTDLYEGSAGEPMIVCYWYNEDLQALKARYPGMRHLGSGVSDKAAARVIEDWNAGKTPMLALHPASAGHGLNLQFGGARMVWYSVPWSAELYAQTIKRLARPGQTRPVFVHHILADHSYERLRMRRILSKIDAEQEFVANMEGVL
jgi:hypothetical protein